MANATWDQITRSTVATFNPWYMTTGTPIGSGSPYMQYFTSLYGGNEEVLGSRAVRFLSLIQKHKLEISWPVGGRCSVWIANMEGDPWEDRTLEDALLKAEAALNPKEWKGLHVTNPVELSPTLGQTEATITNSLIDDLLEQANQTAAAAVNHVVHGT